MISFLKKRPTDQNYNCNINLSIFSSNNNNNNTNNQLLENIMALCMPSESLCYGLFLMLKFATIVRAAGH